MVMGCLSAGSAPGGELRLVEPRWASASRRLFVVALVAWGCLRGEAATFTAATEFLAGLGVGSSAWGDFDNDGDLDLALSGFRNGLGWNSDVWVNEGSGFRPLELGLPRTGACAYSWVDADQDGDLDLAVSSSDPSGARLQLWRNGGGTFAADPSVLTLPSGGSVSWGDVDNDGDLDAVASGAVFGGAALIWRNEGSQFSQMSSSILGSSPFAILDVDGDGRKDVICNSGVGVGYWRGVGGGQFVDTGFSAPGVIPRGFHFGDFDHDGDQDLLVSCMLISDAPIHLEVRWYRNVGGTWVDGGTLAGGDSWVTAVEDLDLDGDPDVVLAHTEEGGFTTRWLKLQGDGFIEQAAEGRLPVPEIYWGEWADTEGDGDLDVLISDATNNVSRTIYWRTSGAPTNTVPTAPSGLTANVSGGQIRLRWAAASDAQTATRGLTYNLRLGASPGGGQLASPHASTTGRRRISAPGNLGSGTNALLELPTGTYYWSVQAIDAARAGGPFAPEGTFTVNAPPPAVVTLPPLVSDATSATLRGEVDPKGLSGTAYFEWGPTIRYGSNTTAEAVSGSGWRAVSVGITGLGVGEAYHVRIVCATVAGTAYGEDHILATPRFQGATPTAPAFASVRGQALGDWDLDGDPDLLVDGWLTNNLGEATMLLRNSDGSFSPTGVVLPGSSGAIAWGDFDRDARLDIAFAESLGKSSLGQVLRSSISVFRAAYSTPDGGDGWGVEWGDADNDGDLDLLITGHGLVGGPQQVWRNTLGNFATMATNFPALSNPQASFGDYDGDGDLDVLVMGLQLQPPRAVTRLFRNQGGALVDTGMNLPGYQSGAAAWADFDGDGDQDLAIGGAADGGTGIFGNALAIWRNEAGSFVPIASTFTGLQDVRLAWGDYDNDGDPDLAMAGLGPLGAGITRVIRNESGSFVELDLGVQGAGPVSWADAEGDGDLDLFVGGQFWRNLGTTTNTPPTAPVGLQTTVLGHRVDFRWAAAMDAQTASNGLTYNLRVGTVPGADNIMAPSSHRLTGTQRLPKDGNVRGGHAAFLELPYGTYYWSVQAVDAGYAGGPWSTEGSFTLAPVPASVCLVASDNTASEPGNDRGRFTVTRTGSTAEALAVNVWPTADSLAVRGVDYVPLPSPVTIPAGSATLDLDVQVIDDTLVEGEKALTLRLAEGFGYVVGPCAADTVWIYDDDSAAPWTPGVLRLDGFGGYATRPRSLWPNRTNLSSFTFESWIRPRDSSGPRFYAADDAFDFDSLDGITVDAALYGSQADYVISANGYSLFRSEWYHVAFTFDHLARALRVAVNGRFGVAATLPDTGFYQDEVQNFTLGARRLSPKLAAEHFFRGDMDEVRISDFVRYSTNFAPLPRFASDAHTKALYHFDEPAGATSFADSSGNQETLTGLGGAHVEADSGPEGVHRGPVGYWRFDENAGFGAADAAGTGNVGTLRNGALWDPAGKVGGCLALDGIDDVVEVPDGRELELGSQNADFTVACWVNLQQGFTGAWRTLMLKGAGTNRTFSLFLWPNANRLHYRVSTLTNWNEGGDSIRLLPTNVWTHVALVKSGMRLRLYLDGAFDSERVLPTPVVANDKPLLIGSTPTAVGARCKLDELRLYGRALTEQEIWDLSSLVGYWRFTEGLDYVARDTSPYRHSLVLPFNETQRAYWVGHEQDYALGFDGAEKEALIPDAPQLHLGRDDGDFAVAFWINLERSFTGSWRTILQKGTGTNRTVALYLWPGAARIHYRVSTAANWNEGGDSVASLPPFLWTHVAMVKNGHRLQLYLNGVLDSERVLPSPVIHNTGTLYLGDHPSTAGTQCYLDELRIYDRGLSTNLLADIIAAGFGARNSTPGPFFAPSPVVPSARELALHGQKGGNHLLTGQLEVLQPVLTREKGALVIQFEAAGDLGGREWIVEASNDLLSWTSATDEVVVTRDPAETGSLMQIRWSTGGSGARFLRLRSR